MKKILTILLILFSIISYSQDEYPILERDSIGNKYVTFTIEQAKEIDNKLDILNVLENMSITSDSINSTYIKIINEKNIIIAQQKIIISKKNDKLDIKDDKIDNLKRQIVNYQASEVLFDKELLAKNSIIKSKNDEIKKIKKKVLWGSVTVGAILTSLLAILIVK